jgi:hypothetical protein
MGFSPALYGLDFISDFHIFGLRIIEEYGG